MAALSLAAMAVGTLYLGVAPAHQGDKPCPCGWKPLSAAEWKPCKPRLRSQPSGARRIHALQVAGNA